MTYRGIALIGVTAALLAITACSVQEDARDHFDRVQDERDRLGEDVTGMLSIDPDTTRFLAEDNGTEFYAARTTSSDAMCLAEVPDIEAEATLSCGNEYEVGVRAIGGEYMLGKRPSSDPGWEELADHFWKNES